MRIIEGNNYYTAQEVADTIGVHIQTVRMWIKTKKMKAVKVGRCFYVNADEVRKTMILGQPQKVNIEKLAIEDNNKYENLKSAIWVLLNNRTTVLERKSVSVDVGNDEEVLIKNPLFAKAIENMDPNEYEYIFSQIYSIAFKRGFHAGYGDFYEDIKNVIEQNPLD